MGPGGGLGGDADELKLTRKVRNAEISINLSAQHQEGEIQKEEGGIPDSGLSVADLSVVERNLEHLFSRACLALGRICCKIHTHFTPALDRSPRLVLNVCIIGCYQFRIFKLFFLAIRFSTPLLIENFLGWSDLARDGIGEVRYDRRNNGWC